MADKEELRESIRSEILKGCNEDEIFYKLFRDRHGLEEDTLCKWFENLETAEQGSLLPSLDCFVEEPDEKVELLEEEYAEAMNGIISRRICDAKKCRVLFVSSRYALHLNETRHKRVSLQLIDCLYQEKRTLKVEGDFPELQHASKKSTHYIDLIDEEHFLFKIRNIRGTVRSRIYLMRLCLEEMKCIVLDNAEVEDVFIETVTDAKNPNNFLLREERPRYRGALLGLRRASIRNWKLEIEEHRYELPHDEVGEPLGFKLEDDMLFVVKPDYRILRILTYKILPDGLQRVKVLEFSRNDRNYWSPPVSVQWIDNICYVLYMEGILLELTCDEKAILTRHNVPNSTDLILEDGIFVGCKKHGRQHVVQRRPLKKIDSLLNLCLVSINQHCPFLSRKSSEQFVCKLPPKYRPFGGVPLEN